MEDLESELRALKKVHAAEIARIKRLQQLEVEAVLQRHANKLEATGDSEKPKSKLEEMKRSLRKKPRRSGMAA